MNAYSIRRSLTLTAALTVGLLSLASVATAATSDGDTPKVVVRYSDLNLDRPEGIEKLYRRVGFAAEEVCRPLESRQLSLMSRWRKCVSGATSRAVAQINVPALTAYANARTGGHPSSPILAARGQ